ncbi:MULTISPECIES: hypothetical protein [Nocardia]|uniref:hypothetical protein n=1 Tax=Nocardia TaxID=1817 RepID=UPI0013008884|nr:MULTISPECIES: hypothetical protein [Nocardia]
MAMKQRAHNPHRQTTVGQQLLHDLAAPGDILHDNLCTAPGRPDGATVAWLIDSPAGVAGSPPRYRRPRITHIELSDTRYLRKIDRQWQRLPYFLGE